MQISTIKYETVNIQIGKIIRSLCKSCFKMRLPHRYLCKKLHKSYYTGSTSMPLNSLEYARLQLDMSYFLYCTIWKYADTNQNDFIR